MSQVAKNTWGAGFCAFLYLLVHFIPDFGGADVMGSQWLYVSVVDFAILTYILLNQEFKAAIQAVLQLKFTIVYSFLVIWALLSLTYSMVLNPGSVRTTQKIHFYHNFSFSINK